MGLGSIVAVALLGLAVFSTPAPAGSEGVDEKCADIEDKIAGWEEKLTERITMWGEQLDERLVKWEEELAEDLADPEPVDKVDDVDEVDEVDDVDEEVGDDDRMADHAERVAEAEADHAERVAEAMADHAERVAELNTECATM